MKHILIPEGTAVCIERDGRNRNDDSNYRKTITKRKYETIVLKETEQCYIFSYKYKYCKVRKNKVIMHELL